jgi:hypothetical protein
MMMILVSVTVVEPVYSLASMESHSIVENKVLIQFL